MMNWKMDRKALGLDTNPNAIRLASVFRSVRSPDDCLRLLSDHKLIGTTGLSEASCRLLESICTTLRAEGLGMEPNLLGRAAASAVVQGPLAGRVAAVFATHDTDFQDRITEADAARDRGDFGAAERSYWLALQYFPSHAGYLVQYGHALKEQNKIPAALVPYFDAYFLGAPKKDVESHALHVAELIGRHEQVQNVFRRPLIEASPEDIGAAKRGLTSKAIVTLIQLLHCRTPDVDEIFRHMCERVTWQELMMALMDQKEFSRVHGDLLRLISETKWENEIEVLTHN